MTEEDKMNKEEAKDHVKGFFEHYMEPEGLEDNEIKQTAELIYNETFEHTEGILSKEEIEIALKEIK